MNHRIIDPRDAVSEIESPIFRVHFVDADGSEEEWQLTDAAGALEAIGWADSFKRPYRLYVEWPVSTGVGLALIVARTAI